jgi:hypothetical protein
MPFSIVIPDPDPGSIERMRRTPPPAIGSRIGVRDDAEYFTTAEAKICRAMN